MGHAGVRDGDSIFEVTPSYENTGRRLRLDRAVRKEHLLRNLLLVRPVAASAAYLHLLRRKPATCRTGVGTCWPTAISLVSEGQAGMELSCSSFLGSRVHEMGVGSHTSFVDAML